MWLLLRKPATKLPTSISSLFLHFHRPSRNFSDILLIKLLVCFLHHTESSGEKVISLFLVLIVQIRQRFQTEAALTQRLNKVEELANAFVKNKSNTIRKILTEEQEVQAADVVSNA